MKLLVVGGSSFIGKNLIANLPSAWNTYATFHNNSSFPSYSSKFKNVKPVKVDLTDEKSIRNLVKKLPQVDVILYLAANSDPHESVRSPTFDLRVNTVGLVSMLEKIVCKRFIYISSGGIYLKTLLPYLFSKMASEQYVKFFAQEKGFSYVVIRFFECFGPYSPKRKIFRKLVNQFSTGNSKVILYGNGSNLIDTMYVDDTAKALIKVIASNKGNVTVDLTTGKPISIKELTKRVAKVYNITPRISYEGKAVENIYFKGNPKPMEKVFNFKASISLEDGIKKWQKLS
jgi:UDP-glucose 4-epimerase